MVFNGKNVGGGERRPFAVVEFIDNWFCLDWSCFLNCLVVSNLSLLIGGKK